jgi:hypothetical protein
MLSLESLSLEIVSVKSIISTSVHYKKKKKLKIVYYYKMYQCWKLYGITETLPYRLSRQNRCFFRYLGFPPCHPLQGVLVCSFRWLYCNIKMTLNYRNWGIEILIRGHQVWNYASESKASLPLQAYHAETYKKNLNFKISECSLVNTFIVRQKVDLRRTFHFDTRIYPEVRGFINLISESTHAHQYCFGGTVRLKWKTGSSWYLCNMFTYQ